MEDAIKAPVEKDKKMGYIDKNGAVVMDLSFDGATEELQPETRERILIKNFAMSEVL
jgi:hypothetical protein